MYQTGTLLPDLADVSHVEAKVNTYVHRDPLYTLRLAGGVGTDQAIVITDPRVALEYFAAIAKAAQELVDAVDLTVEATSDLVKAV